MLKSTNPGSTNAAVTKGYAYNDGDGSTYYDVEYPIQIHGFDPTFHFVGALCVETSDKAATTFRRCWKNSGATWVPSGRGSQ